MESCILVLYINHGLEDPED